jgi:hypothetical protein
MPNPKDPLIVIALERRAKANAVNDHTGLACEHGVTVAYYPRCGRYAWFNENGPVSKRWARALLNEKVRVRETVF